METQNPKTVLDNAVAYYVGQGYRLSSQTENSAQLIKPKQFSCLLATILLLLFVFPFIVYLLYYLSQKDKTAFIVVKDDNQLSITDEKGVIRTISSLDQIAPIKYTSVSPKDDPGLTGSTQKMLLILGIIIIAMFLYLQFGN